MKEVHGYGINGDTLIVIAEDFFTQSVAVGNPLALEPELGGDAQSLAWTSSGWGYWTYPFIPGVDRYKVITQRRMTHICDRYDADDCVALACCVG
jgi:hypothetical protein